MPSAEEFSKALGLQVGLQLGAFRLAVADIGHEAKVLYRTYLFPTRLTFVRAKGSTEAPDVLLAALGAHLGSRTSQAHPVIVHTHYGNPYVCSIATDPVLDPQQSVAFPARVTVALTGRCLRVFGKHFRPAVDKRLAPSGNNS